MLDMQETTNMEQMMAALPAFRATAYEPSFTHTGVDYFGPLKVKRGRAVVKRWGVIFICLNSRAVHLKLASSLESDCFINVLRRFMNLRGPPKCIYSDNRTNSVLKERLEKPLRIGTRSKFRMNSYRRDDSGYFNHQRLCMPAESGRG